MVRLCPASNLSEGLHRANQRAECAKYKGLHTIFSLHACMWKILNCAFTQFQWNRVLLPPSVQSVSHQHRPHSHPLSSRVLQHSVLGPLIFSFYIHTLYITTTSETPAGNTVLNFRFIYPLTLKAFYNIIPTDFGKPPLEYLTVFQNYKDKFLIFVLLKLAAP